MEILEFQKMLENLCVLAEQNEKALTRRQIQETLSEADLTPPQQDKVMQYLQAKGISVPVPLTQEETRYLERYLKELEADAGRECTASDSAALFGALAAGREEARGALFLRYAPQAAAMAADMKCEEIPLADLLQEASISLLTALREAGEKLRDEAWLLDRTRQGIRQTIREQAERKCGDERLVEKVEHLESAVRDLTDEDQELKFSIGELAVILDMKEEEIRDILRLTGDDK